MKIIRRTLMMGMGMLILGTTGAVADDGTMCMKNATKALGGRFPRTTEI